MKQSIPQEDDSDQQPLIQIKKPASNMNAIISCIMYDNSALFFHHSLFTSTHSFIPSRINIWIYSYLFRYGFCSVSMVLSNKLISADLPPDVRKRLPQMSVILYQNVRTLSHKYMHIYTTSRSSCFLPRLSSLSIPSISPFYLTFLRNYRPINYFCSILLIYTSLPLSLYSTISSSSSFNTLFIFPLFNVHHILSYPSRS